MKKKILTFLLSLVVGTAWASEPLKKPLCFVSSDSVVVWGEDRSDFRTTALTLAPQLVARPVQVQGVDAKVLKRAKSEWKKEVLPQLDILGRLTHVPSEEQCIAVGDMIDKAGELFLQTGDAHYIDVVERASLNALMEIATPGELTFEKHIAAKALLNVSNMIYATDDEGIFVNLFVNNSTHIKTDSLDFVIDQLTAMPHSNRVKIRIGGLKRMIAIKICLRMPDWAVRRVAENMQFTINGTPEEVPTIYVNGREESYQMEKGYLVIRRKWNSGDEVFFDFPFTVQRLQQQDLKGTSRQAALQRGPLVYGFSESTEGYRWSPETSITEDAVPNEYGHSLLNVCVKGVGEEEKVLKSFPVMDGATQLWINIRE